MPTEQQKRWLEEAKECEKRWAELGFLPENFDPMYSERLQIAEQEFLQYLKDTAAELTEDEKNALDAECDEVLEAELKKQSIVRKFEEKKYLEIQARICRKNLPK